MPKMFFNQSLKNFRLIKYKSKNKFIKKQNVDFIITKKFDKIFSKTKSTNFIKQYFISKS